MIEILATLPNKDYASFFTGDWLVLGIIVGIIWAAKNGFNFFSKNNDDEDLYY